MSLLCVVSFSVLHTTQALPRLPTMRIHGEAKLDHGEGVQQNEEMKIANLLLHLLQAKMTAKEESVRIRQYSSQGEIESARTRPDSSQGEIENYTCCRYCPTCPCCRLVVDQEWHVE